MRGLPERSWSPGHGRCRSAAAGRRGGHWSNGTVTVLFRSGAQVEWRCVRLPQGFSSPKQWPGGERPWVSGAKASGHTVRTTSPALARSSPVVRLAAGPHDGRGGKQDRRPDILGTGWPDRAINLVGASVASNTEEQQLHRLRRSKLFRSKCILRHLPGEGRSAC